MAHGALTGWSRWWAAVAGYRLRTQSAFASADWLNLASTVPYAIVVLGTSALLAVLGVETAAHVSFLRRHACDAIQGFHFSEAVAAGELAGMLASGRRLDDSAD